MTLIDHLHGLWGISLLAWGLLYIHSIYTIKKFIVDRYEKETSLLEAAFFRNHVPFVKFLPDFFSAGFYGTHLTMCLWGWRVFGNREVFKDITDPKIIVRHFSAKEIWKVKWVLFCGVILFFHGLFYYIFKYLYPNVFN